MSRSLRSCTVALFAAIALAASAGCHATPPHAAPPVVAEKASAVQTATVRLSLSAKRARQLLSMTDTAVVDFALDAEGLGFETISSDTSAADPDDLTLQVPVGNCRLFTLYALDASGNILGALTATANVLANTVNVVKMNYVSTVAGDIVGNMIFSVQDPDSLAGQTLKDDMAADLNSADFAPALNTFVTGLFGSDASGSTFTGSVRPPYFRTNALEGYMEANWVTAAGYIRANNRDAVIADVPEISTEAKSTVVIRIVNSVPDGADTLWNGMELYDPFSAASARLKSFAAGAAPADQTYMNVAPGLHTLRLASSSGTSTFVDIVVPEESGKTYRFDVDVDAANFPLIPVSGTEI